MMERLGESVDDAMSRLGQSGGLTAIVREWPAVVGEAVASHAWPARVSRDGTLHVNTSSSVWAFELTALASEIADRLRVAVGDTAPGALRFAAGPVPRAFPTGESEARPKPVVLSPEAAAHCLNREARGQNSPPHERNRESQIGDRGQWFELLDARAPRPEPHTADLEPGARNLQEHGTNLEAYDADPEAHGPGLEAHGADLEAHDADLEARGCNQEPRDANREARAANRERHDGNLDVRPRNQEPYDANLEGRGPFRSGPGKTIRFVTREGWPKWLRGSGISSGPIGRNSWVRRRRSPASRS